MKGVIGFGGIVLILCVVMAASAVHAEGIRFNAYDVIPVFACTNITYGFHVINDEAVPVTVTLAAQGDGASFLTFPFQTFEIPQQLSVVAQEHFEIPCSTPAGEYPVTLRAVTQRGVISFNQIINVTRPPVMELDFPDTAEVDTCETLTFEGTLTNIDDIARLFRINASFEDGNESVDIDPSRALIDTAFDRTITVEADITCQAAREDVLVVQVQSDDDRELVHIPVTIRANRIPVLDDDDVFFRVGQSKNTSLRVPFTVLGDKAAEFDISTNIAWISTDDTLSLEPGTTEYLTLHVNTGGLEVQNYGFELTLERSGAVYRFPMTIRVVDQTDRFFTGFVIAGIVLLVVLIGIFAWLKMRRSEATEYEDITATPERQKSQKTQRVSAHSNYERTLRQQRDTEKERLQAKAAKERERLQSRHEKQHALLEKKLSQAQQRAEAEAAKRTKQLAKLKKKHDEELDKAQSKAHRETRKHLQSKYYLVPKEPRRKRTNGIVLVFVIFFFLLLVLGIVFPWMNTALIYTGAGALAVIVLLLLCMFLRWLFSSALRIRCADVRPGQSVTFHTKWNTGVGEFLLEAKDALFAPKIIIKKKSQSPEFIAPEGNVYQYVQCTASLRVQENLKGTVRFRLPRKWLDDHRLAVDDITFQAYKNTTWVSQKPEIISQDKKYYYYNASVTRLCSFAIVAKEKPYPKKGSAWWVVLGVLAVLTFIGVTGVALSDIGRGPDLVLSSKGPEIGPFRITEGYPATVNLSSYFSDPDADQLFFIYEPAENLIITISNDIATLRAVKDFTGRAETMFYAQDGKGGISSSNVVDVTVVEPPLFSQQEAVARFLRAQHMWLTLGLFVVLLLSVIMRYRHVWTFREAKNTS